MALIQDSFGVISVLLGVMAIIWLLGIKIKLFKQLALMWMIFGALAMTNFKVIPFSSPVLSSYLAEMLMILLATYFITVDYRQIFKAGPYLLGAFGIGALGVMVGAVIGSLIFSVGKGTAISAGMIAANSIGGFSNHLAVGVAFGINQINPALLPTAALVHTLVTVLNRIWTFGFSIAFKEKLNNWIKPQFILQNFEPEEDLSKKYPIKGQLPYVGISLGIGTVIGISSLNLAKILPKIPGVSFIVYAVIIVSFISLAVGRYIPWVRENLKISSSLGLFIGYFLIIRMSAKADIASVFKAGIPLIGLGLIIWFVHLIFVFFVAGKWLKNDITTLAVTSTANICGVIESPIVAAAHGANTQAPMAALVGLCGTIIATILGIVLVYILRFIGIA